MKLIECEQGTDAWHRARMGIPTASEFHTVLAKGKGGGESLTRKKYLYRLAGEIITGEPAETFKNAHTDRGHEMEPEARAMYAFMHDAQPELVGFVTNDDGTAGASPDSLIFDDGALELKTKLPALLIEQILSGDFPPEHVAQCQGVLWITGRQWIDIAIYWPKLPLFVKRAHRDPAYIRTLAAAVSQFNEELAEIVDRVKRYGEAA
jgi:hypothetical protein